MLALQPLTFDMDTLFTLFVYSSKQQPWEVEKVILCVYMQVCLQHCQWYKTTFSLPVIRESRYTSLPLCCDQTLLV